MIRFIKSLLLRGAICKAQEDYDAAQSAYFKAKGKKRKYSHLRRKMEIAGARLMVLEERAKK